jgi:predicted Zn-dependent protease
MKNLYEVFDEFEEAKTKEQKMAVIEKNLSKTLVQVLEFTFHPEYQWLINEMPDNYKVSPDTFPGISRCQLSTEIRKLYLFQKGNPAAEQLTVEKRNQLLLQIIESIEPREAEVVIGVLSKDLGVKGLNYKFVKEAFPNLLP